VTVEGTKFFVVNGRADEQHVSRGNDGSAIIFRAGVGQSFDRQLGVLAQPESSKRTCLCSDRSRLTCPTKVAVFGPFEHLRGHGGEDDIYFTIRLRQYAFPAS
jgi:hypothetical protein